jgi:hypothetical protein
MLELLGQRRFARGMLYVRYATRTSAIRGV